MSEVQIRRSEGVDGVRTDLFALCWRWRRGRLRREEEAARPDGLSIPISNLRRPLLKGFRLYGGWDGGAAADGEPDQTGRAEEERLELGEEKGRKDATKEATEKFSLERGKPMTLAPSSMTSVAFNHLDSPTAFFSPFVQLLVYYTRQTTARAGALVIFGERPMNHVLARPRSRRNYEPDQRPPDR